MKSGRVALVGAGPGDPGLLTLKAARVLGEADLIIYDTLANPEHLKHAKAGARTICVGKDFRHRTMSQAKINRLIIGEAGKGRRVVRLKGGDPYLFARGGEEALLLGKNNIPFEVVPGVTSASACGAYAGIPLTHREFNSSVTFLTGHRAHDKHLDSIAWDKIVALKGTIVIYMGVYNLSVIAKRLVAAGMRADMPAAVVEWGSLPRQRSVSGSISSLPSQAAKQGLKAPSIIIVGEVASLRKKLNWYEKLPLFGKKIVVTRMLEKAGILSERLRELGADTVEFSVIEIKPAPTGPIDKAIRAAHDHDWVVFTSAYGVEAVFGRLRDALKGDARYFAGIRFACVGPGTAETLQRYGIQADLVPRCFETKGIVEEFAKNSKKIKGKKLLLFRTNIAPPELEKGLEALGAEVERVNAYRTVTARIDKNMKQRILNDRVDLVTFTSASTVKNFVRMVGPKVMKSLARNARFISIGPVTTRALKRFGLRASGQADPYTIDGLVEAVRRTG